MSDPESAAARPTLHMPEWEFQRLYGPWSPLAPTEVARLLDGAPFSWWIAGGWSLEADPRAPRRRHEDVDVAVLASDVEEVRERLSAFHLWEAHGGLRPLLPGEQLSEGIEQLWVRRDAYSPWMLDVVLKPHDGADWLYQRDHRVRLPLSAVVRTGTDGVPYQRPEIALLFKARLDRDKDVGDLVETWPRLDEHSRGWLRAVVELTESPAHPWLTRMDALG